MGCFGFGMLVMIDFTSINQTAENYFQYGINRHLGLGTIISGKPAGVIASKANQGGQEPNHQWNGG